MAKINLLDFVINGGCASKIPAFVLESILKDIPFGTHKNLLVGSETADDASVWKINKDVAIIQTTDFFPPLCSDPYEFGQIAAANALSDIYAMGGKAISALNIVLFPISKLDSSVLKQILMGANDKAKEAGIVLSGGHSIENEVPVFGLSVTGLVHPKKIVTNTNARLGEVLILTKPLGTNQIINAHKHKKVDKKIYEKTLHYMKTLNNKAAEIMNKYDIVAGTDVTGFGFAGHLAELARGSNVSFEIDTLSLPLIEGVLEIAKAKYKPCSLEKNFKYCSHNIAFSKQLEDVYKTLVLDPQTSGGILMSVPEKKQTMVLKDLHKKGMIEAKIVGRAVKNTNRKISIKFI